MTAIRDLRGRWCSIPHDPLNPWVLVDADLREPAIRCSTRHECREWHRQVGGLIVRTHQLRRRHSPTAASAAS